MATPCCQGARSRFRHQANIGEAMHGELVLSNGLFSASRLIVGAGSVGHFSQLGGTNHVTGMIGMEVNATSVYYQSGGTLIAHPVVLRDSAKWQMADGTAKI